MGESTPTEAESGTPDGHDSNRTFEVRAPPRMARSRDGGKRPLIEVEVLDVDKGNLLQVEC